MAAADSEEAWLTFRCGTAACPLPAECEFAPNAPYEDVLAAYCHPGPVRTPVPPGAALGVRPSPDAPDSARMLVMKRFATAAAISSLLAKRYPGWWLEMMVLDPAAPGPLAASPAAPAPKRAREDDAPGNSASAGGEASAARALAVRAPAAPRAPVPAPAPSEDAGGAWMPDDDDEAGPSAPPARAPAPRASPAAPARAPVPAPVSRPRASPAAGGARGTQASPATPATLGTPDVPLQLTLQRTNQKFSSWAAIVPALRDDDVIIGVGTLPGPVVCNRPVTLRGLNNAQRLTISAAKLKPTLTLAACRVSVRFANIHSTSRISPEHLRSTVLVQEDCSKCWIDHCTIIGAGEKLLIEGETPADNVFFGNHGIDLQANTFDTRISHVAIRGVTGSAVLARTCATGVLDHVLMTDAGGSCVWLRGSGKFQLQDCIARRSKVDGIYVDTMAPCILLRCRAEDCENNGVVVDYPVTVLNEIASAEFTASVKTLLASTPHSAVELVCIGNHVNGVLVHGGVAVNLSGAALRDNNLNGLLVTGVTLPGATAPITITGADISGNGHGNEASAADGETFGIAMGKDEHGVSRIAVMVPQGPPFAGVQMSNNRGGNFVEVAEVAEQLMRD